MPYESNADLPEGVRNALPEKAQSIFRNAFNSVMKGGASEESAMKQAWGAVKNAGWTKDKDGNWHKGNSQLDLFAKTFEFDAEIFSTGKWNGDKYSEQDLQDLVDNFNALADTVKPPVKLGHAWKEGQPSLGWVKSLKKVGNKIVATLSEVPEIVYDAIKAGRYKRVSSEIYWNFKSAAGKTFNYVLKAVALLGADIPAVDNLKDLAAYLTRQLPAGADFEQELAYEFETESHAGDTKIYIKMEKQGDNKMSDEQIKKYEKQIEDEKKAREAAEAAAKAADAKLKEFTAAAEKADNERRTKEFKSECERLVTLGKLMPAERDKLVEGIPTFQYSKDGYLVPFVAVREFIEKRQVLDLDEKGVEKKSKEYASASDELADRAKKYSIEHKVNYDVAAKAILEQDPELANRYKLQ